MDWVYFTDDDASNPWDSLPAYWTAEIEKVKNPESSPESDPGILIPAYFYPSWWDPGVNLWDDLAAAASQVPLIAIMNPNSGPGGGSNADYTREVDALRLAGGRVIGYVHTSYGARPVDEVLSEVDAYYAWYNVDGIYFDEAAS